MTENRTSYLRKRWVPPAQKMLAVLVGGLVLWSVLGLVVGDRGLAHLWELGWREAELKSELETLREQEDHLRYELSESRPMAVERAAREKFDMQRPGEIVYYFPRTLEAPEDGVAVDAPARPEDAPGGGARGPERDSR